MKVFKGPEMVLGYFIIKFDYGFRLFFSPFHIPLNIEPLDIRGAVASMYIKKPWAQNDLFLLKLFSEEKKLFLLNLWH